MGAATTRFSVKEKKNYKPDNVVFVIGKNAFNELALSDKRFPKSLVKSDINLSKVNIATIQSGYQFNCFLDDKGELYRMTGHPIASLSSMEYFKANQVKIKKVFTNVCGIYAAVFWLTKENEIYANTIGHAYQLGLSRIDRQTPSFIPDVYGNIIQIQSGRLYSIALCSYSNYSNVIKYWAHSKTYNVSLPNDIINLILMFYSLNKLYSTGADIHGAHCDGKIKKQFWTEIKFFDKHNLRIMKLATGYYHSLCLDSDGIVWCCGNNDYGQLGLGHCKTNASMYPTSIKYFVRYKIKMKAMQCGHSHNLALDYNKLVYSWGNNERGQCGHGTLNNVNKPKLIELFKKKRYKIVSIECGTWHSFAGSDKNEMFLWGSNVYNECVTNEHDRKIIVFPHFINDIVAKQTNYKWIKSVSLGTHNTKIIVSITEHG